MKNLLTALLILFTIGHAVAAPDTTRTETDGEKIKRDLTAFTIEKGLVAKVTNASYNEYGRVFVDFEVTWSPDWYKGLLNLAEKIKKPVEFEKDSAVFMACFGLSNRVGGYDCYDLTIPVDFFEHGISGVMTLEDEDDAILKKDFRIDNSELFAPTKKGSIGQPGVFSGSIRTPNTGVIIFRKGEAKFQVVADLDKKPSGGIKKVSVAIGTKPVDAMASAHPTQQQLAKGQRPAKECIPQMGENTDKELLTEVTSPERVLEIAHSRKEGLCKSLFDKESMLYGTGERCVVTNKYTRSIVIRKDQYMSQYDELVKNCVASFTDDDVIASNTLYANAYQLAKVAAADAQAKALAEQQKKEALEKAELALKTAKQTVRNFNIKDISLSTTKAELQKRIGKKHQKYWSCEKAAYESSERCTLKFFDTVCTNITIPRPNDFPAVVQQCAERFFPPNSMPPAMENISTVAGEPVKQVYATFHDGKIINLIIQLENVAPELKGALAEKYGEPLEQTNTYSMWYGLNEEMILSFEKRIIQLRNPTIIDALNKQKADQDAAAERAKAQAQEQEEKAASAKRKKDL